MKGMKGKLLKKIKSVKPVGYLALENRVFQVSNLNGYFVNSSSENILGVEIQKNPVCIEKTEPEKPNVVKENDDLDDKENYCPGITFRRPDLNSYSLFDPNLLAEFHRAVAEYFRRRDPLDEFEEKCPPGGSERVILYTTTLRGIRKTFEGCASVRFLLESFRVAYSERDVSMHARYRDELREVVGSSAAVPPRLFVRGRDIGGAEEVLGLHERGGLRPLFDDVAVVDESNRVCEGCGGFWFLVCFDCNGSHKVISGEEDEKYIVCPKCNENGLIVCPLCC